MDRDTLLEFVNAAAEDHSKARQMLQKHPELLNSRWLHGETVLHFLAVEGYIDGVRFLAESGADVDATNEFGDTALLDVTTLRNVAMATVLLEHGANPNAPSDTRDNVVHNAARSGSPELLDAILSAGGRSDYVTDTDETVWDAISWTPRKRELMEGVLSKHGARRPGA